MADHRTPFDNVGEKAMLVGFLDYLRGCIVAKVEDADEDDARRPQVASGTSLLGVVHHLVRVERSWFPLVFAGEEDERPPRDLRPEDTITSVVAAYRAACVRSNEVIGGCDDLDRRSAMAGVAPEPMSLRWILVHMIEETARHAGHMDILREQLDGSVGR